MKSDKWFKFHCSARLAFGYKHLVSEGTKGIYKYFLIFFFFRNIIVFFLQEYLVVSKNLFFRPCQKMQISLQKLLENQTLD